MFWAAVIPDGPLHPEDAVFALFVGLFVGLVARRFSRWMPATLVVAVAVVIEVRYPGLVRVGLTERPAWAFAALAIPMSIVFGLAITRFVSTGRGVVAVALGADVAVWGLVADTEPAVIVGGVLGGVLLLARSAKGGNAYAVVLSLPVAAAIIGSVGRPSQLAPALGAAALVAVVAQAVVVVIERRAQRAGTPTTVAPGATSATTTAPAPTTAS